MIIYLKNMVGYKMEHFRGMTYEKVRPIFEREYNKVQTLFKPDKDAEESKKEKVTEEILLQESFKKLKAVAVSGKDDSAAEETEEITLNKEEIIDWNFVAKQIQEKHLDIIRKYQNLNRKPVSIAQARKNMIIYLKNMVGYKMEHFRGMTYDKVRPIFEREYNKVQTLFKPDKDAEEPKKEKVTEEILLQ
nr:hypothetical protein [Tanacetum cinerariifolium]